MAEMLLPPSNWPSAGQNNLLVLTTILIAVTRQMRERRKKLEEILGWKPTSAKNLNLPRLTPSGYTCTSFSFTISDGLRWKVHCFTLLFASVLWLAHNEFIVIRPVESHIGKPFSRGPITTSFRLKHSVIFRQLEDRGGDWSAHNTSK